MAACAFSNFLLPFRCQVRLSPRPTFLHADLFWAGLRERIASPFHSTDVDQAVAIRFPMLALDLHCTLLVLHECRSLGRWVIRSRQGLGLCLPHLRRAQHPRYVQRFNDLGPQLLRMARERFPLHGILPLLCHTFLLTAVQVAAQRSMVWVSLASRCAASHTWFPTLR